MAETEEKTIDFAKPWEYSDIVFVVEEKKVHANKMILCMWSPVFAAMFAHDFKEKHAKEVPLPGKNHDAVIALMKILHPPNDEICGENVLLVLPLVEEYQMTKVRERCEEFLDSQASSVKNYLLAIKYNLPKLKESNLAYMKRAPVARLRTQPEWEEVDRDTVIELLTDKCDKFESTMDNLREVRMVLERKKPTTFPGMHLLCDGCTEAREQQVDCTDCMRSCCKKITEIIRGLER